MSASVRHSNSQSAFFYPSWGPVAASICAATAEPALQAAFGQKWTFIDLIQIGVQLVADTLDGDPRKVSTKSATVIRLEMDSRTNY